MGSSVFHGGFSTFLAISSLFNAKVYYIQVFFKTWCCFIVCGLINGIILQPVLLSFIGPVYTTNAKENKNDEQVDENEKNQKKEQDSKEIKTLIISEKEKGKNDKDFTVVG